MMLVSLLALLVQPAAESPSHDDAAEQIDLGSPLRGSDYLLIAAAARRPELRGTDLSCYRIYVYDRDGSRRVSFVSARDRVIERRTEAGTQITYLPPDPNCRSIDFVMGRNGRVARVIRSGH
jgi:hypothetical protein